MKEHQIESFLERYPQVIEPGLKVLKRQRKVSSGFIDLFCQDKNNNFVIVEIKLESSHHAIAQIAKYIVSLENEGIQRDKIRGILVTKSIDQETEQLCSFFNIETRGLSLAKPKIKTTQALTKDNTYLDLTRTEANIVKIIKESKETTYQHLSEKLELTQGCIRSYVSSIISKNIPISKQKARSGEVIFSIKEPSKLAS